MIRFEISKPSPVSLKVYNISGMLVKTLMDEDRAKKGKFKVFWDGKDNNGFLVSSGAYFYQLLSREFKSVRKVILVR
jgi:flagellar hook assembly protein FlgD